MIENTAMIEIDVDIGLPMIPMADLQGEDKAQATRCRRNSQKLKAYCTFTKGRLISTMLLACCTVYDLLSNKSTRQIETVEFVLFNVLV